MCSDCKHLIKRDKMPSRCILNGLHVVEVNAVNSVCFGECHHSFPVRRCGCICSCQGKSAGGEAKNVLKVYNLYFSHIIIIIRLPWGGGGNAPPHLKNTLTTRLRFDYSTYYLLCVDIGFGVSVVVQNDTEFVGPPKHPFKCNKRERILWIHMDTMNYTTTIPLCTQICLPHPTKGPSYVASICRAS